MAAPQWVKEVVATPHRVREFNGSMCDNRLLH